MPPLAFLDPSGIFAFSHIYIQDEKSAIISNPGPGRYIYYAAVGKTQTTKQFVQYHQPHPIKNHCLCILNN